MLVTLKLPDPCNTPKCTWHLSWFISTRIRLDPKWCFDAISALELPLPHILGLMFKSIYVVMSGMTFPILQSLFYRRNIASLSLIYRYFHGKWSDVLHSLVSTIFTLQLGLTKTLQLGLTILHSRSLFTHVSAEFHSLHLALFFRRTIILWGRLMKGYFRKHYNLQAKNQSLSITLILIIFFSFIDLVLHSAILSYEWLLNLVLGTMIMIKKQKVRPF